MAKSMPPQDAGGPLWSAAALLALCLHYDALVRPALATLALASAVMSAAGLLSQFQTPDLYDFLLCAVMGFSLWQIARILWTGCWTLPELETRKALLIFAIVAMLGFGSYAGVSVTANLSATAGDVSLDLAQQGQIDRLDNASHLFASYVDELEVLGAALDDREAQARALEQAEEAGRGPTGVPGRGSVTNAYAASASSYDQAADLIGQTLARAEAHVDGLAASIVQLRTAQIDAELTGPEKRARLKVLSAQTIGQMRALLALDPARTIRAAADSLARGVPNQSQTNAQSRARIAEINADMRLYAEQLRSEADRIEALAPQLPEQSTLSTAERLLQTAWRLPALLMAALLLDLCGWTAVGFRLALYQALKAKQRQERDESEEKGPTYVTLDDINRVEGMVRRAAEARHRLANDTGAPKRGRPRLSKPAAALPKPNKAQNARKGRSAKGGPKMRGKANWSKAND